MVMPLAPKGPVMSRKLFTRNAELPADKSPMLESAMVAGPLAGRLGGKSMVSSPRCFVASRIAWRRLPAPLSLVFLTVKVESARRSSSESKVSRYRRRSRRELGEGVDRRRWVLRSIGRFIDAPVELLEVI